MSGSSVTGSGNEDDLSNEPGLGEADLEENDLTNDEAGNTEWH